MNSKSLPEDISRHNGCTVAGALSVTAFVKDAATIVHGPDGCAHQSLSVFYSAMLYNESFCIPDIFSSGLSEEEIIFGGEKCLEDAIKKAAGEGYRCIFVIGTCISDTIGDDIESVCKGFVDIPVIPVLASGFLGGSFESGFVSALKAVTALFDESERGRENKPKKTDQGKNLTFNIIGEKNLEYEVDENFAEVCRLLGLLGADINVRLVRNTTPDDIRNFINADLNIIREDPTGEIKEYFDRLTRIPSIESYPYGISGTTDFLEKAGELLGVDPKSAIKKEEKYQKEVFKRFKDLEGRKISFDSFGFQKAENSLFYEIATNTGIVADSDGVVIPIPFYTPVGTTGVRKILSQWRRFLNE